MKTLYIVKVGTEVLLETYDLAEATSTANLCGGHVEWWATW